MSRCAIALILSSLLLGCGGKTCPAVTTPPPAPPAAAPTGPVATRVFAYETAACACKDAACADAARTEMSDWVAAHKDEVQTTLADKLALAQLDAHVSQAIACVQRFDAKAADATADAPTDADATLAAIEGIVARVCACKDVACSDAAFGDLAALPEPASELTDGQQERLAELAGKMEGCTVKLRRNSPPAPDDDLADADDAPPPRPPPSDPRVRPPVAADLPRYLKKVKGKGTLTATIETNLGTLHCALYERETPVTVANFVGLATGQKPWLDPDGTVRERAPFYDGLRFHRVIADFMIQGGDPYDSGVGGPGYAFDDEIVATLHHDAAGVLAMANAGPGTNGSQFFIAAKATPWLDGKHTVFGACAELDVIGKITALAGHSDRPSRPVTIKKLTIGRR